MNNEAASEEEDEIIDTDWIEKLSQEEELYNDFYKEPVCAIKLYLLYVNKDNELQHIKHERYLLPENNVLSRDTIISFIKRYQQKGQIKYKLLSLLRYNIELEPTEITDFLNEDMKLNLGRFIQSEKYLNDIHYADTIHMFQDLNALFFIFYEESEKKKKDHTRRIIFAKPNLVKTRRNLPHKDKDKDRKKNHLKIIKEVS